MKKQLLFFLIIFSIYHLPTFGQGCPNIDAGVDQSLMCYENCTMLSADVFEVGQTTSYGVSSIAHNPPISYSQAGGTPVAVNVDDVWSSTINLPFPFCFYGNTYTSCIVGANGAIGFNVANQTGFHPWSFNATVPSTNLVNAGSIFGLYHDIDPSKGGSINWFLTGTAPCRQFIVVYNNVPLYSCNNLRASHMMVLYETTNVIEVYVGSKPVCNGWNGGRGVIGIQNTNGTVGLTPPGRNTGNWTLTGSEAWQFSPTGAPIYSTVQWYEGTSLIGTGDSIQVCLSPSNTSTTYTSKTIYTRCDGFQIEVQDDVVVSMPYAPISLSIDSIKNTSCDITNDGFARIAVSGGTSPINYSWTNGMPINMVGGNIVASNLSAGTYSLYALGGGGCADTITFSITSPSGTSSSHAVTICANLLPYTFLDGTTHNTVNNVSHTNTFTAFNGCDSIIITNLTVNPIYNSSENIVICESSLPYTFLDGTTHNAVGTTSHTSNLSTINGCDSIITTNLTVNPIYNSSENIVICESSLPYTYHDGTTYNAVGTTSHTSNLSTINGCDSIIITNLTVNSIYNSTENVVICESSLPYTYHDGTTYNAVGTTSHTSNLTTVNGCDSIIITNLTVNPIYNSSENIVICESSLPYTYHDGTTYNAVGTTSHTSNLSTINGCDSVIVTNLTVNPIYNSTENIVICESSLPYTFLDGTTHNAVGTISHTNSFNTINGCDSVIVTNLTVNSIYNSSENIVICESSLPYTYYDGTTYNAVGTTSHTSNLSTINGCDSIITTNLTVNPIYNSSENIVICASSLPYTYHDGTTYNAVGTTSHTSNLSTINGCDSVIVTNLTVNPIYNSSENIVICESSLPYTYHDGTTYNAVGTTSHTSNLSTINGCDSIITTNLTVNPIYNSTENIVICESNLPYTYHDGTTYNAVGTTSHTSNLSTINGCDSVIVTNLTVNPIYNSTENIVICESSLPYTYHDGTTHNAVGTTSHTSNLSTINGCDSVIVTNLTVNPIYNSTENIVICESSLPYTYHDGTTHNAVGTTSHTSNLTTVNGCDSIITTNLTVNPTYNSSENIVICESSLPYTYHDGTTHNAVGTTNHTSNLSTINGCDSIITTNLTVNPIYNSSENIVICESSLPYTFLDGTTHNAAGAVVHTNSFNTINGCDSIIITNLTVNPIYNSTENIVICESSLPYTYHDGTTYNAVGTTSHTSNLSTINGCDSIITTNLTVNPIYNSSENIVICESSLPYTFLDGTTHNAVGAVVHTNSFNTINGCDSIIITNLTVNPIYNSTENIVICESSLPYTYHDGTTYNAVGTTSHTSNLTTVNGCDSIITTNLTVNPIYNSTENIVICESSLPYTYHDGTTYNAVGTTSHTSNLSTINGCDSIITTNLTVNPIYNSTENIVICASSLPYTYHDGTTYNAVGTTSHTSNLSTINGCDSIITTNLTVNPIYNSSENIVICESSLPYTYHDGTTHNAVGTTSHTSNLSAINGCDSVIVTNLTVNPVYNSTENIVICESSLPYTYHDGTTHNTVGTTSHTNSFNTINGCDSVIVTNLTVNPIYNSTENVVICESSLPYTYHDGTTYNAVGTTSHTSNLTTVNGCDSIITTNLTVNPIYNSTENIVICESSLPYTYHDGTTHNAVGTTSHTSNLSTINGCDSVIVTNLTVNPIYNSSENIVICESSLPYTYHDGTTHNAVGTVVHTNSFSTINGCDSIIITNLTVNPIYNNTENVVICESDLPYIYHDGIAYNAVGTTSHTSNLSTINGCDSIITTNLTVNPIYNSTENVVICESDLPYTFLDGTTHNAVGATNHTNSFNTINGCDSIIIINLTVNPFGRINPLPDTLTYCDINGKSLSIEAENIVSYTWFIDDGNGEATVDTTLSNYTTSIYSDFYTDELWISSLDTLMHGNLYFVEMVDLCGNTLRSTPTCLEVYAPHIVASPVEDTTICINDLELIYFDYGDAYSNYEWSDGQTGQYFELSESGTYVVSFTENATTCQIYDTIEYIVEDCVEKCVVEFPTGFSPDASGHNDIFRPLSNCYEGFSMYHLQVFNRWGEKIFESFDADKGWNGMYKGVKAPIEVYMYNLTYIKEGKVKTLSKKGQVSLIK